MEPIENTIRIARDDLADARAEIEHLRYLIADVVMDLHCTANDNPDRCIIVAAIAKLEREISYGQMPGDGKILTAELDPRLDGIDPDDPGVQASDFLTASEACFCASYPFGEGLPNGFDRALYEQKIGFAAMVNEAE